MATFTCASKFLACWVTTSSPQVSNRGLLGRFFEGESMNGTTLRVCAGWRLDLLLKRSKTDSEQLDRGRSHKASQGGRRRRFRIPLQGALQARLQPVPTHDQESCGSRRFDSTSILAALSKD